MAEPLPLATIHDAVLAFLRGRDDAVLFGAHAVNACVDEPRMTQDVDVLSTSAEAFADELQQHLSDRFHVAVRVRDLGEGKGLRLDQVTMPKDRHLVDVRHVAEFPPSQLVAGVRVVSPAELVAEKVIALQGRRGMPKAGTDWRDIAVLLLAFPELKVPEGAVRERLAAASANAVVLAAWRQLVAEEIVAEAEDEDEEFGESSERRRAPSSPPCRYTAKRRRSAVLIPRSRAVERGGPSTLKVAVCKEGRLLSCGRGELRRGAAGRRGRGV